MYNSITSFLAMLACKFQLLFQLHTSSTVQSQQGLTIWTAAKVIHITWYIRYDKWGRSPSYHYKFSAWYCKGAWIPSKKKTDKHWKDSKTTFRAFTCFPVWRQSVSASCSSLQHRIRSTWRWGGRWYAQCQPGACYRPSLHSFYLLLALPHR